MRRENRRRTQEEMTNELNMELNKTRKRRQATYVGRVQRGCLWSLTVQGLLAVMIGFLMVQVVGAERSWLVRKARDVELAHLSGVAVGAAVKAVESWNPCV